MKNNRGRPRLPVPPGVVLHTQREQKRVMAVSTYKRVSGAIMARYGMGTAKLNARLANGRLVAVRSEPLSDLEIATIATGAGAYCCGVSELRAFAEAYIAALTPKLEGGENG